MTLTISPVILKELEEEVTVMLRRFGYDQAISLHVGIHHPEMTLIKATLDPSIIKVEEILKEFPHPPNCFVNLDLLVRYLLKTGQDDENILHEELEQIVAHAINGAYLHRKLVLERDENIKPHASCQPRITCLPFTTKKPLEVIFEEINDLDDVNDTWNEKTLKISTFTHCLANWITPPPVLAEVLLDDSSMNRFLITQNVLPEIHAIWGLGCEQGFFPLSSKEHQIIKTLIREPAQQRQDDEPLQLHWMPLWDELFIIIDESRQLQDALMKPRVLSWVMHAIIKKIPEIKKKPLHEYALVLSTPQSWILIPKNYMTSNSHREALLRRLNHLIVREHVITAMESFEMVSSSTTIDVAEILTVSTTEGSNDENTRAREVKLERIIPLIPEENATKIVNPLPSDYMEKQALPFWTRPVPLITPEFIRSIPIPQALTHVDPKMKIPHPLTSIIGTMHVHFVISFRPFFKIPCSPNYLELLPQEHVITVKSLLHFKIWVKTLKKALQEWHHVSPTEIVIIPKKISIMKLFRPPCDKLTPFEQKLFRHALTDTNAVNRILRTVKFADLQ